jgi:hypothetical protein
MPAKPGNLDDEVLRVLIAEILGGTEKLVASMRQPPGRNPSPLSRKIAGVMAKLDDTEAMALVRDVQDVAVFRLCYLLENEFETGIEVVFRSGEQSLSASKTHLHEKYRMRVDPGGVVVD